MRRVSFLKEITKKRYVGAADLHITNAQPRYRKDPYWETCKRKLTWLVDFANSVDATILIAGDTFDNSLLNYEVVNPIIEILKKAHYTPIVVAGQHDQIFHAQNLEFTPLYNLELSGAITILNGDIAGAVYGQHYGGVIPVPVKENPLLLVHRGITPEEPPFFLQDMISAAQALEEYKDFKVVVSGDYHQSFYKRNENTHLVNCGPMMRSKKDQINVIPCVWSIVIGSTVQINKIPFPIESGEKVFDLKAIEYDAKNSVTVDTAKLKELMNSTTDSLVFEDIVWKLYKEAEFKFITKIDIEKLLEKESGNEH